MSWKKHFTVYRTDTQPATASSSQPASGAARFSSWLPEVYTGQPNRVERYAQYDQMDMDAEINAALDTISEFSTQFKGKDIPIPFEINYKDDATESEVEVLERTLKQWCNINDWDQRIFRLFRSTIKYGDQFLLRDPESYILYWVNPVDVTKIVVNDAEGKKPEQYIVRNLDVNMQAKTASEIIQHDTQYTTVDTMMRGGPIDQKAYGAGQRHNQNMGQYNEFGVHANHMIHLALTEGMDANYPFGTSILDPIFKTYKQKELLEDSIIIYRVQRAPERRVFYIDVGNMPAHKAMAFVERVKNDIHQRRIPNKSGGGTTVMDASYNPLSIMEDYFFATTAEGRGSKVEVLPGGDNLGEIDDLKYFNNKMMRALRVPISYLPTGPEEGTNNFTDGRVGTAYIQEFRFNKYCMRLQRHMQAVLDKEFKLFVKHRGINVDSASFELNFFEPQNFSNYREIEVDNARASVFSSIGDLPFMSRRFTMRKYLGLSDEEILENERMWREENGPGASAGNEMADNLSSVGVRPMDTDNMDVEADLNTDAPDEPTAGDEGTASPITGDEQVGGEETT